MIASTPWPLGLTVVDVLGGAAAELGDGDWPLDEVTLLAPVPRPAPCTRSGSTTPATSRRPAASGPRRRSCSSRWPARSPAPGGPDPLPRGGAAPGLRGRADDRDRRRRRHRRLLRGQRRQRARSAGPRAAVDAGQGRGHVLSVRAVGDHRGRDRRVARPAALRTWVNGELRQDSRTSDLIFSCPELVEFIGQTCTLTPGDLILTGTPSGVGMAMDPPALPAIRRRGADRD